MKPRFALLDRCAGIACLSAIVISSSANAQRVGKSRFSISKHDGASVSLYALDEPEAKRPHGMQIVAGYLGAILVGFLAWRAFDEPAGQHSKVKDDWGYTPDAHTALGLGSYVGATLFVWGSGRRRGAHGTLLGTAIGAAIPTIPLLLQRDDPLFPFVAAMIGAPLQGVFGYLGYRATAN